MRYGILALSLWIPGVVLGQSAAPVAGDDAFNAPAGDTLAVQAGGVLTNDSDADGDSLIAILVDGPSNGMLTLQRDGSFRYTPEAGFTGMDGFTYVAEEARPEPFVIDGAQSGVRFTATLHTAIGSDTDSDSTAIAGTLTADVRPNMSPFSDVHVGAMDLTLVGALHLSFGFSPFGGLDVDTEPAAVRLFVATPGLPAPLTGDTFVQMDNEVGILGTLNLDASGLLAAAIEDGPRDITVVTQGAFEGTVSEDGGMIHLTMPLLFAGTFDVEGNNVDVTVAGALNATAPIQPAAQASNVATVTLTVGLTTATEALADVPAAFALGQNYPNPFNPVTTIAYALPTASDVTLTVYDLLGRPVETLVEAHRPAGRHQAVFEAAGLPSGVYVYRLQAGTFTATKKLVVLK